MYSDGIEQLMVELHTKRSVTLSLHCDHGLECFQSLEGSFETDCTGLDVMPGCGLCHDRTDEIVGQHVCPDFLANEFLCFAAQDIHLHGCLDGSQIEFIVPPRPIQECKICFGRLVRIKQGRDDNNTLRPEPVLFNTNASLSNREILRKRFVRFSINRSNQVRLAPADNVIIFPQTFSFSKVRFAAGFVQSTDRVDATLFERQYFVPTRQQTIGQKYITGAKDIP
jgi:hypothetical protein